MTPNGWHSGPSSRWALFADGQVMAVVVPLGEDWRWQMWHSGPSSRWALFADGQVMAVVVPLGEDWRWQIAFDHESGEPWMGEASGWENTLRQASLAVRSARTLGLRYNSELALQLGRAWSGQV